MQSSIVMPWSGFAYKTSQYSLMIGSFHIAEHLENSANNSKSQKRVMLNLPQSQQPNHLHHQYSKTPLMYKPNVENAVTTIMSQLSCIQKSLSQLGQERPFHWPVQKTKKGSSLRMNGTLNTKEVNLGQHHAAEPGTTAIPGTGQTAEGTALGVHMPFRERYPSRDCYRLLNRNIRCGSSSYYNMHYHQDNFNTLHVNNFDTEHISIDCTLEMDTAQDGETIFFTIPPFKTNLSKIIPRDKIDTGVQACTKPPCPFRKCFPTKSLTMAPLARMHYCLQRSHGQGMTHTPTNNRQVITQKDFTSSKIPIALRSLYLMQHTTGQAVFSSNYLIKLHQHKQTLSQHSQSPKPCHIQHNKHHNYPLRTIYDRTNNSKTIIKPPSKTMILKLLKTAPLTHLLKTMFWDPVSTQIYQLPDDSLSQFIQHDKPHIKLLHHHNRHQHKTCTADSKKVPYRASVQDRKEATGQSAHSQYTLTLSFKQLHHTQHSIHINSTLDIAELDKE